ncbi:universal stress protein [Haloquadratum walsbyi]|jgi:Universal stress protein family.|uniref:Universal stress protein UspA related nucleotide-binding protein n=1 Tax=Haloquadratum walsbyi J07HQW2 TaxID=1238425 RepID=U1PUK1_9EURY|nr:universal stress protein [Haloquadratum walsbyi]ERG96056.1 MAG: universal stress protein UspA related nucleotide-binding protein [Haloquadratum walsbyi J07HQW2]
MSSESDGRTMPTHVLLPVANEDDALKTARALEPYKPNHVTTIHVVEKSGGAPDKTSVEQAEESCAAIQSVFPDAEDHTVYGQDVAAEISKVADEVGASAIAYRSRGGSRLMQFLSADVSTKLVTKADRPIIALPRGEKT